MFSDNTKEKSLRESMFVRMNLSMENESIARQYLDMDKEEDPALLEQVQPQELPRFMLNGSPEYLKWLHKNKRSEELSRYVRFAAQAGGSSALWILVNDDREAKLSDLENMLAYLTGDHAEEQKMAIRAELCVKTLCQDRNTKDTNTLCQIGKEDPQIVLRATAYCSDRYKAKTQNSKRTQMLLTAVYLYCTEAGTEPELSLALLKDLLAEIPTITAPGKAFSPSELQSLQCYVRTAKKDTPFPQNVLNICSTRLGWMDVTFLAGCAFLAVRHSVHFEILFRLTLAEGFQYRNRIAALDIARAIVSDEDFHANMEEIEEMIPILDEDYIIWCLYGYPSGTVQGDIPLMEYKHAECEAEVRRMAVRNPDGIRAAISKADSEEYRRLTELVQDANPALYEEIRASYQDVFRSKFALELVKWHFKENTETAIQYLLGKCPLDDLIPQLKQLDRSSTAYLFPENYKRMNHLKTLEEFSLYRRAVILETLKGVPDFFEMFPVAEKSLEQSADSSILYDKEQITGIFRIYTEENVPVGLQLEALGSVCDNVCEKKDRTMFLETCVEVALERQQEQNPAQWDQGIMEALGQCGTSASCICLRVLAQKESLEKYKQLLFNVAQTGSDQVQKQLVELFKKHSEWDADVLALLASKKQKARAFAIMVLEEWAQTTHLDAVNAALANEKNKKLAVQLKALAQELEQAGTENDRQRQLTRPEERLAAEIYKGSRKRKVEWVGEMTLPKVHFQDKVATDINRSDRQDAVPPQYMLSISAAYADMEVLGVSQDAKKLAEPLSPQELAAYMRALYNGWMAAGAEAKKRWVLYAAAIHGDAEMIVELHRQIKEWSEHSRGAVAAEAVRALALNGSPQALLLVDQMARKFKSNQIKNAAKRAISEAAAALGISSAELEDRIVPDFGFNAQAERAFDYGTRTFTVRLNPSLDMEIYDESDKKLKSMPKTAKQDDPVKADQAQAEYKQLKKQLKLVVASQKLRLEQALSTARFWQARQWRALFVQNPVMRQFAVGLIWGIYEDGLLKDTFRYMEDGSFNTIEETEYTLPESCIIGLVHPLELSEDALAAWTEQLSDYEITQPIEQLKRPVYRIAEEEKGEQKLMRFYGRELNGLTLSNRLLTQGWVRGEIMDAGFFDSYCRMDSEFGAKLMFSGCSVGYENEDVTIDDLYFYRILGGTPRMAEPCRPEEVSARYLSETLLQIARSVGEASA